MKKIYVEGASRFGYVVRAGRKVREFRRLRDALAYAYAAAGDLGDVWRCINK